MIRSSVKIDCFTSVSLKVTDSPPSWRKFRGSVHEHRIEDRSRRPSSVPNHNSTDGNPDK